MKAQSLWIGTDYAWQEYRGRGNPLPLNATRVKVMEIIKKPIYGGSRDRTYARVRFLDDEGNPKRYRYYDELEVKARDIIDFWEQYEEDRRPIIEERARKEQERLERYEKMRLEREEIAAAKAVAKFIRGIELRGQRLEQEKLRLEAEEAARKRRIRLNNVLIGRGLKPDRFTIANGSVTIPVEEMERWLGFEQSTQ